MCKVGIKSRVSNIESDNSQNVGLEHVLRTANEGIIQRYLKIWADVADKICFGRT